MKKTTPKAPVTALTDPLLAALLSFIDGGRGEDGDGRHAALYGRALAGADELLTSQPITSAFELLVNRPSIDDVVSGLIEADIPNWTAPQDSRRAFNAVEDAWHERGGDSTMRSKDVRDMMPAYVEQATYLGACLMYRLLKGGAR